MIDQFINFVIRPPRAEYIPDQYLWEANFTLGGRNYKRKDVKARLSGGDYVSLGWHERDDLKVVVSYLRNNKQISCIGLWGRSMGAVTSLLYGADDSSIAGMVLDSAFSNLFDLMMELVDVYKIRLPKFTVNSFLLVFLLSDYNFLHLSFVYGQVKMAVQYMRRIIQKKAKFDIMDLDCLQVAPKTFIPALFGHATEDKFIRSHHSDLIFKAYMGDKNIIKFDGDHNSPRPQFYYDSVSIFFYNVLQPPNISSSLSTEFQRYYELGGRKVGAGMDESILYEIISGLQTVGTDAASSSAAPCIPVANSLGGLLLSPITSVGSLLDEDSSAYNLERNVDDDPSHLQVTLNSQHEECCSYASSNRESWGRCSSLGGSDRDPSFEDHMIKDMNKNQMTLKALATPLRRMQRKLSELPKEKKKLEALSQRLRLYILKRVKHHRRHRSS
ncbi:hypothetical protein IFM89_008431 [Coptis chinensis]|uniref:Serine aminopeptidase S33 domain-containing protein n=1 Tax=Coptis chinensis TaxID=261450 RepID=A0A835GZZ2_9MAGN|nr:hypothetical protein IFM89_008431 [Coptis chinensis]